MDRSRRADIVGPTTFAMQCEPDGRRDCPVPIVEDIPNLRFLNAVVPRRPHFDASLVTPIEAVGNDAVFAWRTARRHVGLNRAGDGRKARYQDCVPTADE